MIGHHGALFAAYAGALIAWAVLARRMPALWPATVAPVFAAPWREVLWALLAAAGVVGIGVLYSRGWLLPATSHRRPALDALNQLVIYSPFLLLLPVRRQGPETAWLPTRSIPYRIALGVGLAVLALFVYALLRPGLASWAPLLASVYSPRHVSYLVQVLLEDIAVAVLFVRLRAALGLGWTLLLVAILFAAAHIPGLLAGGAAPGELVALLGDVALGLLALSVLQRAQDVWWFWMVHFALDMTQFFPAAGA